MPLRLTARLSLSLAILAATVLAVAAPASADCCLYFSTGANDTLGRVPLTGSNPRYYWVDTAGGGAFGLAGDGAHLYWGGEGMIGQVGLDGPLRPPNFIGGLATAKPDVGGGRRRSRLLGRAGQRHDRPREPRRLDGRRELHRGRLSHRRRGRRRARLLDRRHSRRDGRANLDGSCVDPGFITGADLPGARAVEAAHVYWTNFGADSIGRANLDGSGVVEGFIGAVDDPLGIAVDEEHVYWTDLSTGGIGRASLDGSDVETGFIDRAGATPSPSGPPGRSVT